MTADRTLLTSDEVAAIKADADARASAANADAAETAALAAARQEAEAAAPDAVAERQSEIRKSGAEAKRDAAAAQTAQISALMPDFSKVEPGSLQAPSDQPLFATTLAYAALEDASEQLVRSVAGHISSSGASAEADARVRVLVTSDTSLASSDATFSQLSAALAKLVTDTQTLIESIKPPTPDVQQKVIPAAAAAAAVASAVPAVLSLLSAHRSVSASSVDVGSLAACASIAGRLKQDHASWAVSYDDIRILASDGPLQKDLGQLTECRERLVALKLGGHVLPAASPQIDAALQAIDSFVTAATAVPSGATSSPLMTALLRESLHDEQTGFTHALCVTANLGSAQGVTDDRPLWLKDKFTTMSVLSITYFLLGVNAPDLLAAGTIVGSATGSGTIGDSFNLVTKITGGAPA